MLQSLLIKNYALIEYLEWELSPHFNIITGETGAGKSIILGAIGLLTGERADLKALFNQEEKCVVEGVFNLGGYDHLQELFYSNELDYEVVSTLRREIAPSGKSRAFINDTPVNLDTLKEITNSLMDVHSQHQNLLLGSADFQLQVIDIFARNKALLQEYKVHYKEFKNISKNLHELKAIAGQSKKDLEYETFLLQELIEADLKEDEQQGLEEDLSVLENAEEIKLKLNLSIQSLSEGDVSINAALTSIISDLGHLSKLSTVYEEVKTRAISCLAELKDITNDLGKHEAKIEADPEKAQLLKERVDTIFKLQKKHGAHTIVELLNIQAKLKQKVDAYDSVDAQISDLENKLETSRQELTKLSSKITASRENTFDAIESNLITQITELGMPNATFTIKNEKIDFTETGADKISMLFSANKGVAPASLRNAASGGEFSRLMFALKYLIADQTSLPTMIFDEIDTGISGEIAMKMGQMMKKIASGHQIITITHLHQIAAKGDAHFYVFKEHEGVRTKTNIKELKKEARINEIAQMIGGKNPSSLAFESAKELISAN